MRFIRFHIALLLILTFTTGLVYQTFTVGYFYWNRAEIAEKHCVNKDKPEMNCHGKCHLEKKLTAAEKATPNDTKTTAKPLSFWLFGIELPPVVEIHFTSLAEKQVTVFQQPKTASFIATCFVPPDFV